METSQELKPISGNKRKASSTVVADLVCFNAMQSTNVQIKGVMFFLILSRGGGRTGRRSDENGNF